MLNSLRKDVRRQFFIKSQMSYTIQLQYSSDGSSASKQMPKWAEVGIANFFEGPLIANPLIFFWNPLNANPLIFNIFKSAYR
jgi:hypothetical protein